jgi:ABC-type branched-subunit amino acid transport system substrate-binding protein
MNKKALAIFVRLSISLLLLVFVMACSPAAKPPSGVKTLKIGAILPFTGPAAMYGEGARPVMQVYADLVNEEGGINIGNDVYNVELFFADGQFEPVPGAAAARNLIYDHDVNAIVGYFGMGFSAISPITNAEKVIFITMTGYASTYRPEKDPYVVFGLPAVEMAMNQAIATMQAFPGYHVLCWTGTESARRAAEPAFELVDRYLEKEYGIKSLRIYYPEGTTNFVPFIARMAERGTEVVFSGGTVLEVGLLAKQRWEMGYRWPIGQTSDNDLKTLTTVAGAAAQGVVGNFCPPSQLKKVQVAPKYLKMTDKILQRYVEVQGEPLTNYGPISVCVNQMGQYFEAVQQAGTTDPDKVMNVFRGGTFDTFMGRYTLSGEKTYGSPIVFGYPCAVGQIQGDKVVYIGEFPLMDADMWYDVLNP